MYGIQSNLMSSVIGGVNRFGVRAIPSEVFLNKSDGMQKGCAINLDHIQTVSKGRIGSLITVLSSKKMSELRSALFFALGFSESSSDHLI